MGIVSILIAVAFVVLLITDFLWVRTTTILILKAAWWAVLVIYSLIKWLVTHKRGEAVGKPEKKQKFYVAKFCKELWSRVHKEDRKIIREDSTAQANYRLGVITALEAVGVERTEVEGVAERIERNGFN